MDKRMTAVIAIGAVLSLLGCHSGSTAAPPKSPDGNCPGVYATNFNDVTYGNGVFVAVGDGGGPCGHSRQESPLVEVSTDGVTWAPQFFSDQVENTFDAVTYGTPGYLATTDDDPFFSDPHGQDWHDIPDPGLTFSMYPSWDGSQYILNIGAHALETSSDGSAWQEIAIPATDPVPASPILKQGGKWYAIVSSFSSGTPSRSIGSSIDLSHWTVVPTPCCSEPLALIFAGSQFVAVGETGLVLTSPDGVTWTTRMAVTTLSLNHVAYNGSLYVAIGSSVQSSLIYSVDGARWHRVDLSPQLSGEFSFNSITAAPHGAFVIVGASESAGVMSLASMDGIHWTGGTPPP